MCRELEKVKILENVLLQGNEGIMIGVRVAVSLALASLVFLKHNHY